MMMAPTPSLGRRSGSRAGEQDLTENIIHLVLAKLPGAPDRPMAFRFFVVPKFLVNEDGSLGEPQRGQLAVASRKRWASTATPPA